MALLLNQARFEVVLQTQQHVAVGDRRVKIRRQFVVPADDRLQQLAQFGRAAYLSVVKWIEDQSLRAVGKPDQKCPGKASPAASQPWARAVSMNRIPSTTGSPFRRSITRIRLAFCKSS